MNNKITYQQIVSRLEENNLSYGLLSLHNGVTIIVSQHGGRVFGPFLSPEDESVFWVNRAFSETGTFKDLLASGDWNLGGERIWIAPEIQYAVPDRADYWGTIAIPPAMDPGQYRLEIVGPNQWRLEQDLALEAHNLASGRKELYLERLFRPVEDPLRYLDKYGELLEGVIFAGYEQVVSLSERVSNEIMSESWNIIQLNPGGLLLIPATPAVKAADYYEPVDDSLQTIYPHYVSLRITGQRQYKVGYKAAHVFGRLAYFNHLEDGRAYLIVRNFFNNPSMPYLEEPPHRPGQQGDSIHIYNDGGELGGFGELECHGQAIGGVTGRSTSADQMQLWLYVGASDRIKKLAAHFLGLEL